MLLIQLTEHIPVEASTPQLLRKRYAGSLSQDVTSTEILYWAKPKDSGLQKTGPVQTTPPWLELEYKMWGKKGAKSKFFSAPSN